MQEVMTTSPISWLSTRQTANKLGISRRMVMDLIHSGQLKANKFGYRTYRINTEEVDNYIVKTTV
mgnify:CR=1 FL=1